MVVCTEIDKDTKIDNKLLGICKKKELGLTHASFRWTSLNGIINYIKNNYYKKEDLRYEVLKGVNMYDKLEYEYGEAYAKKCYKMQK